MYTEYTGAPSASRSIVIIITAVVCLGNQRGTWQVEAAAVVGDVANTSIELAAQRVLSQFQPGLVLVGWLASPGCIISELIQYVAMVPRSLIINWPLAR